MIEFITKYFPQLFIILLVIFVFIMGYSNISNTENFEKGIPSQIWKRLNDNEDLPKTIEGITELINKANKMGSSLIKPIFEFSKNKILPSADNKINIVSRNIKNSETPKKQTRNKTEKNKTEKNKTEKNKTEKNKTDNILSVKNQESEIKAQSPGRTSKGELECKRVLEEFLETEIKKVRPDFLKSKYSGKNLEIDCYCEKYKIGVEYNGQQHYENVYPGQTSLDFQKGVRNDALKKKLCKDAGVFLIEVPYFIPHNEIENFIVKELKKEFLLNETINNFQKIKNYVIR